jgi:hypothetical protein
MFSQKGISIREASHAKEEHNPNFQNSCHSKHRSGIRTLCVMERHEKCFLPSGSQVLISINRRKYPNYFEERRRL